MIDNLNKICEKCHIGRYIETGFFDDMDGLLHCERCGHQVKRHPVYTDKEKLDLVKSELGRILPIGGAFTEWAKELLDKIT